jgi:hypothetical protein
MSTTTERKTTEQLDVDIAHSVISGTEKAVKENESLVQRLNDAKAALDFGCSTFKASQLDYMDDSTKFLNELRLTRMAIDTETKRILTACADARKFFTEPEHVIEMQRMREFVGMMEKLKALKESGFLDAVADTILKLSK